MIAAKESALLRYLFLILLFGWLLRSGLRLVRFFQGQPPRQPRRPRPEPKPEAKGQESKGEWDGERIEEADYEELP